MTEAGGPAPTRLDRALAATATGTLGRVLGFFGTVAIALWRTATGIERRERERRGELMGRDGDRGEPAG